jgi:heme A synthase
MRNPWLHRCAILLAVVAFLSMCTGTTVTSNEERPLYAVGECHLWLSAGVAMLSIAAVLCMRSAGAGLWVRRLGWMVLAVVAVEAALGFLPLPQPPAVRIAHAFLAQLFFPLTVAIAALSSTGWKPHPAPMEAAGPLLLCARITPIVVLAQVALGTLFRHGALGIGPHLIGAFLVALFMLAMALPVIYGPEYRGLQLAAKMFLTAASVQVFLGLALFSMQSMDVDPAAMIVVTMVHAGVAGLTLAATIMLAVLIRRDVVRVKDRSVAMGAEQG